MTKGTGLRSPMGYARKHRGFVLVETGHRYFHACRGTERVAVGSIRHGDFDELCERFRHAVDEYEGR